MYLIRLLLISFLICSLCYSQNYCKKGGFSLGYENNQTLSDSIPNAGTFSFGVFFLKKYHKGFNTSFGAELNIGKKSYNKVLEDIEFDGDYVGYADYAINRFEAWGKFQISKQINDIIEISIPVKIGYRSMGYLQSFELYEGQEIKPEDIPEEGEESSNSDRFSKNNSLGLGTGINIAFIPNKGISPFIEATYNYYGKINHYMVEKTTIDNGTINIPNYQTNNSSDFSFRIGIRFNIGKCPEEKPDVFTNNNPSKRTPPSVPKYETQPKDSDPRNSNNSSGGSTNTTDKNDIKLKPKIKPKTKPVIIKKP